MLSRVVRWVLGQLRVGKGGVRQAHMHCMSFCMKPSATSAYFTCKLCCTVVIILMNFVPCNINLIIITTTIKDTNNKDIDISTQHKAILRQVHYSQQ